MTAAPMTQDSYQAQHGFRDNAGRKRSNTSVFTCYRLIVSEPDSDWHSRLKSRFNELTALPIGWDGYDGKPVSFQCASFAAAVLAKLFQNGVPAPNLVPGADGSLQIEWHRNGYDVELDVLGAQHVIAMRLNHETQEEELLEVENDFSRIATWIAALADSKEVIEMR